MKVIDIKGNKVDRKLCKKYKSGYYLMNEDCFKLGDKWLRKDSRSIIFNHSFKRWIFNNSKNRAKLIKGVVDIKNGIPEMGFFSMFDPAKELLFYKGKQYSIFKEVKYDFIEVKSKHNLVILRSGVTKKEFKEFTKKKVLNNAEHLEYESRHYMREYSRVYNSNDKYTKLKLSKRHKVYRHLSDITWGCEFETSNGEIPIRLCKENGLIPLRDGSLRRIDANGRRYLPFEYATVVLSGEKGIGTIVKQTQLLNKYCETSHKESLHMHIGNIPYSKEYVTSMYILSLKIQDELYSMFPYYTKHSGEFKGKDYCSPMRNLYFTNDNNDNFYKIHEHLLCDYEGDYEYEGPASSHPLGSKWNISERYRILNLIPLLFSNQQTVEWRVHNSTFDPDKIVNWVFILNAISKYANKYRDRISKNIISDDITLNEIITDVYSSSKILRKYIKKYISYRKDVVKKYTLAGDKIGIYDEKYDNILDIKYPIKSLIR